MEPGGDREADTGRGTGERYGAVSEGVAVEDEGDFAAEELKKFTLVVVPLRKLLSEKPEGQGGGRVEGGKRRGEVGAVAGEEEGDFAAVDRSWW